MERSGCSGRDSLELLCPEGCTWTEGYREPMQKLHKETFYFHFNNLCFARGRNKTFLCYTVESKQENRLLHKGVFQNQVRPYTPLHAELRFLSWFHDTCLRPGNSYQVTLYMSWSPCSECAEELTTFLAGHRNVALTIFVSKLYYCYADSPNREGLKTLAGGGATLLVMFDTDFEYCWTNFANCGYNYFEPWPLLDDNSKYCNRILQDILKREMTLMKEETFRIQFNNAHKVPKPYHRRVTYLCYQVQKANGNLLTKGCLRTKKGYHAESRFIKRICSLGLHQAESYQVTCFLTWSPCPHCAQELVLFKSSHPRLYLRIFTARLYFHWKKSYQEGLQRLCGAQIPVAVMGRPEFAHCWDNFVDHQPGPFEPPWDKMDHYSKCIKKRFQQILKSWGVHDLTDDFRNLHLGPTSPPVLSRDPR